MHAHERRAGARLDAVARYLARFARRHRRFGTFRLDRKRTDGGRADAQFQTVDDRILGLPVAEHLLAIVRLNPVAQEARGDREPDRSLLDSFELDAREPAREHVLTEFDAQTFFDLLPALLVRARHHSPAFFAERLKRATQAGKQPAMPDVGGTQQTMRLAACAGMRGRRRPQQPAAQPPGEGVDPRRRRGASSRWNAKEEVLREVASSLEDRCVVTFMPPSIAPIPMVFVAGSASRRDHQFVVCIFHATDGALWRDSTYRARDCDETERYRPRQSSPAPIFLMSCSETCL